VSEPTRDERTTLQRAWAIARVILILPLGVPLALLLLVWVPLLLLYLALKTVVLQMWVWVVWCSRGTYVLLVTSDSPHWQDRIAQYYLPLLPPGSVILNWSERTQWQRSLATELFHHFGGDRAYNPLALVFRPPRWVQTYRFYDAFRARKHGKPAELRGLEREFLRAVAALPGAASAAVPPDDL
jgi:hypothetical protein